MVENKLTKVDVDFLGLSIVLCKQKIKEKWRASWRAWRPRARLRGRDARVKNLGPQKNPKYYGSQYRACCTPFEAKFHADYKNVCHIMLKCPRKTKMDKIQKKFFPSFPLFCDQWYWPKIDSKSLHTILPQKMLRIKTRVEYQQKKLHKNKSSKINSNVAQLFHLFLLSIRDFPKDRYSTNWRGY